MNLQGKSRDEIAAALAGSSRAALLDIIVSLVEVEQLFKPSEIAKRSAMDKRTVLRDMHAGLFGGEFFKRAENQVMVSASGVNAWRAGFRVTTNGR